MTRMSLCSFTLFAMVIARSAQADPAAVEHGLQLAQANCTPCHAIGAKGDSPNAFAPRFRELGQREPGKTLDEIFAAAVLTGHPDMPRFGMRGDDQKDIFAYIATVHQVKVAPPPLAP